MKNEYLDKMVIKPDYVVWYNPATNGYTGEPRVGELYTVANSSYMYVSGWAASKSHPNDPVQIFIDVFDENSKKYYDVDKHIVVYKIDEDSRTPHQYRYTGKHNLFIYTDRTKAIWAGKEMSLYDEIDNAAELYRDGVKTISNIFNNAIQDPRVQEYRKRANDTVNTILNNKNIVKAKEVAHGIYNKAKDTTKSGLSRLIDEMRNTNVDTKDGGKETKENNQTTFKRENCTYVKYVGDNRILLQHLNNGGNSIFYYQLNTGRACEISAEQYKDMYGVLSNMSGETVENVMNSINDILNPEPVQAPKPKKTFPIQFCQFREQDVVKHEPQPNKRKFQIGDTVIVKKTNERGTIIDTQSWMADSGKKLKYVVEFSGIGYDYNKSYYSYELEKFNDQKQELLKRIAETEKVLNKLKETEKVLNKLKEEYNNSKS